MIDAKIQLLTYLNNITLEVKDYLNETQTKALPALSNNYCSTFAPKKKILKL